LYRTCRKTGYKSNLSNLFGIQEFNPEYPYGDAYPILLLGTVLSAFPEMTDAFANTVVWRKRGSVDGHETINSPEMKIDMAAKRHKKHKNKISGLVISMAYNE